MTDLLLKCPDCGAWIKTTDCKNCEFSCGQCGCRFAVDIHSDGVFYLRSVSNMWRFDFASLQQMLCNEPVSRYGCNLSRDKENWFNYDHLQNDLFDYRVLASSGTGVAKPSTPPSSGAAHSHQRVMRLVAVAVLLAAAAVAAYFSMR